MRACPFEKSTVSLPYFDNGKPFDTYMPTSLLKRNDIYLYPTVPFLRKVEYTANDELIYPSPITFLKRHPDGRYDMQGSFNDVGKNKKTLGVFNRNGGIVLYCFLTTIKDA